MTVTVRSVEPLDGFRLRVTFSDGLVGEVNVDPRRRVRDPAYFRRVEVSGGTVVWPNETTLASDALHAQASEEEDVDFVLLLDEDDD